MRLKARVCLVCAVVIGVVFAMTGSAAAGVAAPLTWSAGSGQLTPAVATTDVDTQANLLENGGFEAGTIGWSALPGASGQLPTITAQYNTTAHDGGAYLEATTSDTAGSVYQDVDVNVSADGSATFSIWVRAAAGQAVSGQTANVCLIPLGLSNDTYYQACQQVTLSGQWQQAETTMTTPAAITSVRAQIYFSAPGVADLDGGVLTPNLLTDGGFEEGGYGWDFYPGADGSAISDQTVDNGQAHDGNAYMQVVTTAASGPANSYSGSIYQDTAVNLSADQSVSASIWVRLDPSDTPAGQAARLCVFDLSNGNQSTCTSLTLTNQWQQLQVTATVSAASSSLRTQVYLAGPAGTFDFDSGVLTSDLMPDGGFDVGGGPGSAWSAIPANGGNINQVVYTNADAHDGSSFLETNTSTDGSSIYQDVPVSLPPDSSATLSLWLRAAPNQVINGQSFSVCLWALGQTNAVACNVVVPSFAWQEFQVTQTLPAGTTTLRSQIYMDTGLTIDVDGVGLGAPQTADAVYAPEATGTPAITGSTAEGSTLTCSQGSWAGTPYAPTAYSYAWLRGGTPISGATATTYTTTPADSGAQISCAVSAANAGGASTATSPSVGPIGAPAPAAGGSGSSTGPGAGSGGASTGPTTRSAHRTLRIDNLALTVTATALTSCTTARNQLTVTLSQAAAKTKRAATATVVSVGVFLGSGVKHRRKVTKTVKGKKRTVTVTSYTANLTFRRLPASGAITVSGATSTARTLRAVLAYRQTTTAHGQRHTVTKRATLKLAITTC